MHRTLLLADIGGTNARFTLLRGGAMSPLTALRLDKHVSIEAAIADYLGSQALTVAPDGALLAVAGPMQGNSVTLTNRGWQVSGAAITATLGIPRARVLNDFEALAWALPVLGAADLVAIGPNPPADPHSPMAVLGPGTGLGVGAFLPGAAGQPGRVLPGEGGHASLAATDDQEAAILALLRRRHGHVSAERILSGPGLVALHAALAELQGRPAPGLTAAEITAGAPATLAMFCDMLGSFAGNVALTYGARGGVFLGGGILPRLPAALAASAFRARFEAKGRLAPYLAAIPTWLITRPDAALVGLANLAAQE
jgi:glucokinase